MCSGLLLCSTGVGEHQRSLLTGIVNLLEPDNPDSLVSSIISVLNNINLLSQIPLKGHSSISQSFSVTPASIIEEFFFLLNDSLMNILFVIVHHWNPHGAGTHQSLRPDPTPRIVALQNQILSILRYGPNHQFHMKDRAVYRTNESLKNNISLRSFLMVSTVLDKINPLFIPNVHHIPVSIDDPKMLTFEAHRILFNIYLMIMIITATSKTISFFLIRYFLKKSRILIL